MVEGEILSMCTTFLVKNTIASILIRLENIIIISFLFESNYRNI
jgi:hypothetical protein